MLHLELCISFVQLLVAMCLVNCCVVNVTTNRTIFPWSILSTGDSGVTVRQFYEEKVVNQLKSTGDVELEAAFLGKSKESLDIIDLSLSLDSAVPLFGPFLRYRTRSINQGSPPTRDALAILMSSQRQMSTPGLPPCVSVRTKKDQLFNDFVGLLKEENVAFPANEINSSGQMYTKLMVDSLWYVDGHHDTLQKQSFPVPQFFQRFVGYNTPELSKHRKRRASNMSSTMLNTLASSLFQNLQAPFWSHSSFQRLLQHTQSLAKNLAGYADYLSSQNKTMKALHARTIPMRQISDSMSVKYIEPGRGVPIGRLENVIACLHEREDGEFVVLNELMPSQPRQRYEFIQCLERNGISVPIMLLTYSSGNNAGNLHFVWKLAANKPMEETFQDSVRVIERVKPLLPQYHTRAMRRAMFDKFGRVSPNIKPAVLRFFYRDLTGDASSSHDTPEAVIDERVREIINMEPEDPNTIVDLREVKSTEKRTKFNVFWDEAQKFINEDLGVAVDDRRHGEVTHLAKAISIRDLREQVSSRCPPGTPIPSDEWLRLQFWPKTKKAAVSMHYTGRLNVRFMVQKRQFRKTHDDDHYAAAVFRYLREYSIQCREYCTMVCIDDKHRLKVGEPGFPVAAAERGRKVIVRAGTTFEVGDHDFTKFSIIPSVTLIVDIPHDIQDSWYRGQVLVGFKDAAFEASSPIRHATELSNVLSRSDELRKPVLFMYSDGGPDHRLTYVSVQVSLIVVFKTLDLDFLCAARTAPSHSWKNPVERIMSTLNLGLQCVGLMREKGDDEFEAEADKCKSLATLRDAAKRRPEFRAAALDSIAHVKSLLVMLLERLELKGKKFSSFPSASEQDIDSMWEVIQEIDSTIEKDESLTKKNLSSKQDLSAFMKHCCVSQHYSFQIKKCGSESCSVCGPIRLPKPVFDQLHFLPDPVPGEDGHYKGFKDLLGTKTDGTHRPSLQKASKRTKTLPFSASVQHVKNVDIMLQCDECCKWRLLYCKFKLTRKERADLQTGLQDVSFTCGAQLQDLELPGRLNEVYTRIMSCEQPIEKLYYSAKYSPICVYCAEDVESVPTDKYPQCVDCAGKPVIPKV